MRIAQHQLAPWLSRLPIRGPQLFVGRRPATDYDALLSELLADAPAEGFWLFAYGSLMWNPVFDHVESRIARARGWRRTFCLGRDYRL